MKKTLFLFLICWSSFFEAKAYFFEFNENCIKAQEQILKLKLEEGRKILKQEQLRNPNNLIPVFLENYVDFFDLFISENRAQYKEKLSLREKRLDLMLEGPIEDPFYSYTYAEIELQWSILRMKFGDQFKGALGLRDAYNLLTKNRVKHPSFLPNLKSVGMFMVLIGTVPEKYQWAVNLIGMQGNIDVGMALLENLIKTENPDAVTRLSIKESIFIYSFLEINVLKNPEKGWKLIEENTRDYKTNLLNCFVRAQTALRSKKNDEVIRVVENRPKGNEFVKFHFLDYLLGMAKLRKLDPDADQAFLRYVSFFGGENLIKDSYQKLSWFYLLKGDKTSFEKYRLLIKTRGHLNYEDDKQAMREVESGKIPDINLLKARLLYDGAYYNEALLLLNQFSENSFQNKNDQAEYVYRKARVFHDLKNYPEAKKLYILAIEKGKDLPEFYAANSALMLGNIFEDENNKAEAKKYYNLCFSFPNKEYRNSIQQKAKAGLKRLE